MSFSNLDCIVIGYNDLNFEQVLASAKKTQQHSPIYSELMRNSVAFRGQQLPYMELFNATLSEAKGNSFNFHVCDMPNLGVCYLSSYLHKRGLQVAWINFFNREKEHLIELLAQDPLAVAITTTFYVDHAPIKEIIEFVRTYSPRTRIVLGGPHIFNLCSDLDNTTQDFVFKGMGADVYVFDSQGEKSLSELLLALRKSKGKLADLNQVSNLIYTEDNITFSRTPRAIENNDMDENVVDWSMFDQALYIPTVQMRTARSCAFKCAFCRYPAVGGPLELNSVDVLEREFHKLKQAGVRNLVFIDDTFNVPLPRFKKICQMMIRNQFDFEWFSYFRCSNADEKAFDLMAESGCRGVFLGIESGDQKILNNMNKAVKLKRYVEGIKNLKARNILTYSSFIVGFPGETEETFRNTLEFIDHNAPTFFNAGIYYHDTKVPIHQRAKEFGLKGGGFNWQHDTMHWREANERLDRLYLTVENSTILPTYMFDFWAVPYLMSHGFSIDEIEGFGKQARGLLKSGLCGDVAATNRIENELVAMMKKTRPYQQSYP